MAFRKVVAVLNGTESDESALATALAAARPFEGHVEALYVRLDPRDAVVALGEGISGPMVEQIIAAAEQESNERQARARASVERLRQRLELPVTDAAPGPGRLSIGWRDLSGTPEEVVVNEARLSDLLVLSRATVETDPNAEITFETALLECGRPLLLAPSAAPARLDGTVVVAWNGSAEGARSLSAGLDLLVRASRVVVVTVETAKTAGQTADDIAGYLAWHGIRAEVRRPMASGEPVGATLLKAAVEAGADLLITGGYGHSRWRELILGGVTRHLLTHATVPVLMSH
jgi:nucleotide-binding universal stress UspA family protein